MHDGVVPVFTVLLHWQEPIRFMFSILFLFLLLFFLSAIVVIRPTSPRKSSRDRWETTEQERFRFEFRPSPSEILNPSRERLQIFCACVPRPTRHHASCMNAAGHHIQYTIVYTI